MIDYAPQISNYIQHILPNVNGWCPPEKASEIATSILGMRPINCVEIGVFAGRSAYAIGLALKQNGAGICTAIDPWSSAASIEGWQEDDNYKWWSECDHDAIYQQFMTGVHILGLKDVMNVVRSTSAGALAQVEEQGQIDFLHIDGNHSEEHALFDVEHYVPLVRGDCQVWFDDTDWNTTKKAQQKLLTYCDPVAMTGNCGIYRRKFQE